MRARTTLLVAGLSLTAFYLFGGCAAGFPSGGGGGVTIPPVAFNFNEDADGTVRGLEFTVTANEPADITVPGATFTFEGFTVSAGTVELPLAAIEVEPTAEGPGKHNIAMQAGEPLSVTVWVASPGGAEDSFCANGDQYGPFTVTLDENFMPTSIDPPEVTLTEATVALINAGSLDLCLRVNWTQDARVTITSLTFALR